MQVYYICVSCSQMNFLRIYFSVEHCCCLWYIFILLIRAQEWSFSSPFLDNEKNILSTQWTRLRRFSVDSTMKIHIDSPSIFHGLRRANPRVKNDIDSTWITRRRFNFQNWRNIDEFSTCIFLSLFNVESI